MSSGPPLPEPTDLAAQRAEDAQYYRRVLHKLIDMGADLAEAVHRQAAAQPAPTPEHALDHTIAFDRLARAVRRTVALARKLTDPDPPSPARQAAARARIDRATGDAARREAEDDDAEALCAEPHERADGPDLDPPDPDFDGDLDEQALADLLAAVSNNIRLASLPDDQLWPGRAPKGTPNTARSPRARAARPRPDHPEMARSRAASHDSVTTPPAHPGTGPPDP